MKVAIGCDHIVTGIKDEIIEMLKNDNIEVVDCGTYDYVRTHYPIFGVKVADAVVKKEVDFGIVICGTGVGITNSAQKIKGARVVLARDVQTVVNAKEKYDANIIGFGGRITGVGLIYEMIKEYIKTQYHKTLESEKLIQQIDDLVKFDNYNYENLFDEEIEKWDSGYYDEK